jgi:hypothetical protein
LISFYAISFRLLVLVDFEKFVGRFNQRLIQVYFNIELSAYCRR